MNKYFLTGSLLLLIPFQLEAASRSTRRNNKPWFSGQARAARVEKATAPTKRVRISRVARRTSASASTPAGRRIAQQARLYCGTKYKFGGTTERKGFDCSGLIARVWADLKLKKVPRVSSQLYQAGTPVHLADLREGDLVFFKNTYKAGISHVGVYAGKNKFIHAPSTGKRVSITRLSDPYYQLHYAGARRLY